MVLLTQELRWGQKMDKHIDKSQFEFVEVDEKIFDTKFEGKPRSFMKDAMS